MFCKFLFLISFILCSFAKAYPTLYPETNQLLKSQATQLDRLPILNDSSVWYFNFVAQSSYRKDPGSVVTASVANFPAVIGNGMGSTKTYFYEENGARLIVNTLTPNTMTIFPQAALHTMFNEGCTEATLVSALSSEDPGTLTFANSLFELPIDLVSNAFGGDVSNFRSRVPNLASNAIAGTRDCLARCRK
ncbi:hypothetical protein TWF106_000524 [Orbilia oligospora]|uniref:Cupin type-1 domain-containing protein n=1 Tax=Orbilia oligospora TaxID=2813651 RepID=A0A6G1MPD0_ORBOL|nr:hypothetical protein TWF788_009534 [Orbilia oligospora]KAF3206917.1 hypothetical protein TWF106_000524 [Orbilia oligospora]KAF3265383.1 hypothetical protein TWF192_000033 [Orbilia oligospora]